ncbi:hypothetical protein WDU94_003520 [Cyamophila willieti]
MSSEESNVGSPNPSINHILSDSESENEVELIEQEPLNTQETYDLLCREEVPLLDVTANPDQTDPLTRFEEICQFLGGGTSTDHSEDWYAESYESEGTPPASEEEVDDDQEANDRNVGARSTQLQKSVASVMDSSGSDVFAEMSWSSFVKQVSATQLYTLFIDFSIPAKWKSLFVSSWADFRQRTPLESLLLPATSTTSTSSTTAHGRLQPAAAPLSGDSKVLAEVMRSESKEREGGRLNIASSAGFVFDPDQDQVLKLDILPYSRGSTTEKKDWWQYTTFRSTITYLVNSELGCHVKKLKDLIMTHMETKQVGEVKVESKEVRERMETDSSNSYGRFQRRP